MSIKMLGCFVIYSMVLSLNANAANILGFFVSPSPSHIIADAALVRGLLAKGHNITVVTTVSHIKISEPSDNYHEVFIDIDGENSAIKQLLGRRVTDSVNKSKNVFQIIFGVMSSHSKRHNALMNHKKMKDLLASGSKFDLFILDWTMNEFHLGVAGHFGCPTVVISTARLIKPLRDLTGNPAAIESVPLAAGAENGLEPMSFTDRLINFFLHACELLLVSYFDITSEQRLYKVHFPADQGYPSLDAVRKNVSLVLVSSHFTQGVIRPLVPGVIEIAGIQLKNTPDPLPEKLQLILDASAAHGAILFSFGSNVKPEFISTEKLTAILNVFSKLQQKVLMKWNIEDLPIEKPDNVHVQKWLPQADILAHPNLRLFISHCGAGSVSEAKFHGVPILAIPLFSDQPGNAKEIVNEGWSIELSYSDITESNFSAAVTEMLTNEKYRRIVERKSVLYRDRPQTALETAVFWTEYVLRHNGAKHIKSPTVYLNFFQQNSLDLLAAIAIVLYLTIKVISLMVRFLWRKCRSRFKKEKSSSSLSK